MELSKKTTILLSPRLFNTLKSLSKSKNSSIGELIRSACEAQYSLGTESDAHAAVDQLSALALPVDSPGAMKAESVLRPEDLLP